MAFRRPCGHKGWKRLYVNRKRQQETSTQAILPDDTADRHAQMATNLIIEGWKFVFPMWLMAAHEVPKIVKPQMMEVEPASDFLFSFHSQQAHSKKKMWFWYTWEGGQTSYARQSKSHESVVSQSAKHQISPTTQIDLGTICTRRKRKRQNMIVKEAIHAIKDSA